MYNNIDNNAIYSDTNSKSNTRKRKLFFLICYSKLN